MQHETAPYVHPLHDAMRHEWIFWRLSYEGGREYLSRYLSRHENELGPYYQVRIDRAVYPNIVRSIVDTYTAHVFHAPVTREEVGGLSEWHTNIDMQGNHADEFYRDVLTQLQIYGSCGVLTDRYDPDGFEPVTRAQEAELGRRPYLVVLPPCDIVDWSTDRFGRLRWLIHRDQSTDDRDPLDTGEGTTTSRFKLWTAEEWRLLEVATSETDDGLERRYRVVDEGTHPCGRVPVQFVYFGKRTGRDILGESAIKDLAPLGRRITNLTSLIDEQAYQHVFNIMVVPSSTFKSLKQQNFSTAGCITYEPDEGVPFYLAPEVDVITVLRSELNTTFREARVLSGLGRQNEDSKAPTSGRSMAFQTMDKVALLRVLSERMSALELEVDRDMLAWMEETADPVPAEYDTDFDPEALSAQLNEAMLFDSFGIGGVARAQTMKAIARSYLGPRLEADELKAVLEDIDDRFTPKPEEDALGGVLSADGANAAELMNGIQARAMVEVAQQVTGGNLALETAIGILMRAFAMSADEARALLEPLETDVVVDQVDQTPAEDPPQPATPEGPAN